MRASLLALLFFLFPVSFISSCARMVAPGGGPEDTTPPEVVSIEPQPGPGNTGLTEVTVTWSERLDESSASVFIYPHTGHELRMKGTRMVIRFEAPVGDEPVIIHLPGEIRDRRGNRLESARDIVYSAADSLPSGRIEAVMARRGGGRLSPNTLAELFVDDKLLRRTSPDTLGMASLDWLAPGVYRLVCYEDRDGSYDWDPETEAGQDTTVSLAPGDSLRLELTMTVVDTVGPRLMDADALDAYHVLVSFNEEVSYASFGEGEVLLEDSLGEEIPVNGYWLSSGTTASSVVLSTNRMPDAALSLHARGIEDLLANPSEPDSLEFYGVDSLPRDTLRVRSFYPPQGSDNADPSGPFLISFSYWIHPDSLVERLTLTRVADSAAVSGELKLVDGRSFEYHPEHQLIGEQQYRFELRPGLYTLWGDTLTEPFSWSFSTLWGDEPGALAGRISGTPAQEVILQIRRTGGGTDAAVFHETVSRGSYRVEDVPAGRYTVAAFVDLDASGTWSPAEPYGTYPGVVLVQPGLVTEDVDIEILP